MYVKDEKESYGSVSIILESYYIRSHKYFLFRNIRDGRALFRPAQSIVNILSLNGPISYLRASHCSVRSS
jgi:hypothetical protein